MIVGGKIIKIGKADQEVHTYVHNSYFYVCSCGGTYTKIKEPENYGKKKTGAGKRKKEEVLPKGQSDIRSFSKEPKAADKQPLKSGGGRGNIFGFGGTSFASPSPGNGIQTKGKAGAFVVQPGWKVNDNSSAGRAVNSASSSSSSSQPDVRDQLRKIWARKEEST